MSLQPQPRSELMKVSRRYETTVSRCILRVVQRPFQISGIFQNHCIKEKPIIQHIVLEKAAYLHKKRTNGVAVYLYKV